MATANLGKQEISIGYKQRVSSLVVNKLFRGILRPGLYTGGQVSVVNSNTINLEPYSVLIDTEYSETDDLNNTTVDKVTVKVSSFEDIKFDTTGIGVNTQKVLWGSFNWLKVKANYMDFGFSNIGANPVDSIVFTTVYFDNTGSIVQISDENNTLGTEQYILSYINENILSIKITQLNHGFTTADLNKPIYSSPTGFQLAQADTLVKSTVVGFVESIVDANNFYLKLPYGKLDNLVGVVPGDRYFLDPLNPGLVTTTEPVTFGQIKKLLYVGISATEAIIVNEQGEEIFPATSFTVVTVPNNTTVPITTSSSKVEVMEFIAGSTNQNYALIFYVAGQTPAIQTFPNSLITSIQGTVGYINIYENSGLELENKTGSTIQIRYKVDV